MFPKGRCGYVLYGCVSWVKVVNQACFVITSVFATYKRPPQIHICLIFYTKKDRVFQHSPLHYSLVELFYEQSLQSVIGYFQVNSQKDCFLISLIIFLLHFYSIFVWSNI